MTQNSTANDEMRKAETCQSDCVSKPARILTQTTHTARQPFMSRFLCVFPLMLERPPLRDEIGGALSVLNESYTFKNTMTMRRSGTTRGIVDRREDG